MSRKRKLIEINKLFSVRRMVLTGIILLLIVSAAALHREVEATRRLAAETTATLKQQCITFNKLTASDRTKSLFRLSDLLKDFRNQLYKDPSLANDESLERYVDSMRISGVAILDDNLRLIASGHTRRFQNQDWTGSPDEQKYVQLLDNPEQIYIERITLDGEYYDICALAREDERGLIIGFFHQPPGIISDTESDLESLLSGLKLERNGCYAVTEGGDVRVSSDESLNALSISDNECLSAMSQIPKDGRLHVVYAQGKHFWGYRSGCGKYSLYVYYPVITVVSSSLMVIAAFAVLYSAFCILIFAVRDRALNENKERLEKSNHDLTESLRIMQAFESMFFCFFYIDLKDDGYTSVYLAPWVKRLIPESGDFEKLKKTFLDSMVLPAYRDDCRHCLSADYINETLGKKKTGEARKSFYFDYQSEQNDKVRWCRITAIAVDYDEAGQPVHILALLQDVDAEKAKEANYQNQILKEAHEAKVANNAKNEFLRRISHDIRTPINGIQGYIELGSNHPDDAELQKHCRDRATTALHTLQELVNSVLEMSNLESNEIILEDKPFNLSELLDEVNAVIQPQAEAKSIRYEVIRKGDVPIPYLIGSPRHISQVLMNLAINAVKFGRPGGYVRLNTRILTMAENTVTYEFVCADNGIGMSEEFKEHLFEPFTQEEDGARTTYHGTGLGLSIVKKLVDAMGGTIICHSTKNVGTTFCVQLTFKIDMEHAETEKTMAQTTNDSLSGTNILLVEDNELNMEISEYMLKEYGANVTRAWNGKEAVEAFTASAPGFFNLIIMDIMMPVMDGLEAARTIRALDRPDAKTVQISAMSANSFPEDIKRSMEAGMNAHISKPIDEKKLVSIAIKLLK